MSYSFKNYSFKKNHLKNIIYESFIKYGINRATYLADSLKDLGFYYATQAAISISIEDLKVPPIKKELIQTANEKIEISQYFCDRGDITEVERFQRVIDTWNQTSEDLKNEVVSYFEKNDPLNSVYMMAFSGARGNLSQVRQLVGMRGLMADPNGQIIDLPIKNNFREGLTITDYIISSYGARKGIVDTALKTADSGYLTRRLVDVAQDLIIREVDCGTKKGVIISNFGSDNDFKEKIIGRTLANTLILKAEISNNFIIERDNSITPELANKILESKISKVLVRSPLTCSSGRSICQKCYGWNLADGNLVNLGEAVGIIAAQSIGEPGTQLTMRTFHTGGVFTAESNRQIKSKFAGRISFSPLLKARLTRTMYGEEALLAENFSSIYLVDYENNKIKIEVSPDVLIFTSNNSFVKKNQILIELPASNQTLIQDSKNIISTNSGEISFGGIVVDEVDKDGKSTLTATKNGLVWVLSGSVYNVPSNSFIKLEKSSSILDGDSISRLKILNNYRSGFIKLKKLSTTETINNFEIIYNLLFVNNSSIYNYQSNKILLLNNLGPQPYILKNSVVQTRNSELYLGEQVNYNYQTTTGGTLHFSNFDFEMNSLEQAVLTKSGKVLWVPEERHQLNKDISLMLVEDGTFVEQNTEIIKDIFSQTSGIIEIIQNNGIVNEIRIIQGVSYPIFDKTIIKKVNNKLFYPGEEILDTNIIVKQLSWSEVVKDEHEDKLLVLRPVSFYNISKPYSNGKTCSVINQKSEQFSLNTKKILNYKDGENLNSVTGVNFVTTHLILKSKIKNFEFDNYELRFKYYKNSVSPFNINFSLLITQTKDLNDFIPKELKLENFSFSFLVKNNQYVELGSTLSYLDIPTNQALVLKNIKRRITNFKRLLIVTDNDYKTLYNEDGNFLQPSGAIIRTNDRISNLLKLKSCGKVSNVLGSKCEIHLGKPYFLSQGAIISSNNGDFIRQGETLATLLYERIVSGDIVQGLPRIEEILEARKPKNSAILSQNPGFILSIFDMDPPPSKTKKTMTKFVAIIEKRSPKTLYEDLTPYPLDIASPLSDELKDKLVNKIRIASSFDQRAKILVSPNEIIGLAHPIAVIGSVGVVNHHDILNTCFDYYKTITSLYNSAYTSLRNIQLLILASVQSVYNSQGVTISNKHNETIVKQMASKVRIIKPGKSNLLQNELVELNQVNYMNLALELNPENLITYTPVLLGITKSSLATESFISAASFQETTRILTEAAIEGKIDWLRGLKESVIIGRLIPAGTGFNTYNTIANVDIRLPSLQDRYDTKSVLNNSFL